MLRKIISLFLTSAIIVSPASAAWSPEFQMPAVLPGEFQSISIAGSTVLVTGLTDQQNSIFINGREVPVTSDGSFNYEMIVPIGQTQVIVEAISPSGERAQMTKDITANENHFFMVGIADGTVNFADADEGLDWRRDNSSFDDGTHVDGKISYYLAGKVKGKYLIKSSLDTDKATQEKLFTNIDPDKYYPIYGDNSTVVYDAHSQGKFYLRVDWDRSGIVIGNYQTQIGSDKDLAQYNRTLYGGKVYLESNETTVYGDPVGQSTYFVAEANQYQGHSELLGSVSSLYYLRHRNIVEGSEQIRLEVRDKFSRNVRYAVPLAQNIDYEIKYDEGHIILTRPPGSTIPSQTFITLGLPEGNEIYVIADYEYKDQATFPVQIDNLDTATGGLKVSQHVGDHVRVGGTFIQEQKEGRDHAIYGGDATVKIGNYTQIDGEYALTTSKNIGSYVSYNGGYDYTPAELEDGKNGKAFRIEAKSSVGEYLGKGKEFLDVNGYYQAVDNTFSQVSTLYQSGTRKAGAGVSHRINEANQLRFAYEDAYFQKGDQLQVAQNDIGAARSQHYVAQWTHDRDPWQFTTEFLAQSKKDSLSAIDDPNEKEDTDAILAERIGYTFDENTSVFVGQQFGLDESEDNLTSAGIRHQVTPDIAINLQGSVGEDRNAVIAGIEEQVNPNEVRYMNVQLAENVLDGRETQISHGTNTQIGNVGQIRTEKSYVTSDLRGVYTSDLASFRRQITPQFKVDASYERREVAVDDRLRGSIPRDALSTGLSYVKPDAYEAHTKFEYRVDTGDEWLIFWDSQGEIKLTQDWFLFLEYEYSKGWDDRLDIHNSRIDKKHIGLAYRPVEWDWLNFLVKYIRYSADRPHDLTSADGGFSTMESTYDEFAGEVAVDLPYHFQFVEKVAYRDQELLSLDPAGVIESPDAFQAYLVIHRLNYHLTNKIDLAAEYRTLRQVGSFLNDKENGFLIEMTYQLKDYLAIGGGYNFTSIKENFVDLDKKKAEGFFLRVQGKH